MGSPSTAFCLSLLLFGLPCKLCHLTQKRMWLLGEPAEALTSLALLQQGFISLQGEVGASSLCLTSSLVSAGEFLVRVNNPFSLTSAQPAAAVVKANIYPSLYASR